MFEKDIEMVSLGFDTVETNESSIKDIELKKKINEFYSKARQDAKGDKCYYCGCSCTSFCNSHSIPAFCLENIAINGYVYYSNEFINMPIVDKTKGIKKAGTFHIICRDCDSKIFQDYEDPKNFDSKPTEKMLAQIAMKNYLHSISKRLVEISLYDNIKKQFNMADNYYQNQQLVHDSDLIEYKNGFQRAKKVNEKNWDNEYYLFYYEKLMYTVPLAFQDDISIITDLNGKVINDIYNMAPDSHTKDIHVCIFPMKNYSVIMMFVDSKHSSTYRGFYKQFNKLESTDKLSVINYLVFCYSENIFLHKGIDESVLTNKKLIEASRKSTLVAATIGEEKNAINAASESFDLSKRTEVPNLLLEEYKINKTKD